MYSKVILADRLAKTQLSCISALDKKAWNTGEAFFGELKGGFCKDFPIGFCSELIEAEGGAQETSTGIYLVKRLREQIQFEMKVGNNGKVWVSARMADTVFIFNAFERCL